MAPAVPCRPWPFPWEFAILPSNRQRLLLRHLAPDALGSTGMDPSPSEQGSYSFLGLLLGAGRRQEENQETTAHSEAAHRQRDSQCPLPSARPLGQPLQTHVPDLPGEKKCQQNPPYKPCPQNYGRNTGELFYSRCTLGGFVTQEPGLCKPISILNIVSASCILPTENVSFRLAQELSRQKGNQRTCPSREPRERLEKRSI